MVASFHLGLWRQRSVVFGQARMTTARAGQRTRRGGCQGLHGSSWHPAQPPDLEQNEQSSRQGHWWHTQRLITLPWGRLERS